MPTQRPMALRSERRSEMTEQTEITEQTEKYRGSFIVSSVPFILFVPSSLFLISMPLASKAVFFKAAVKCAAAQAQGFSGAADVAIGARERLSDQQAFNFFKAQFLNARGVIAFAA